MPNKILLAFTTIVALLLVASCGGNDPAPAPTATQGVSRSSTGPLTNQDWERAASEPNNYVGSRVELKGRIFHVIGMQDGTFHFQMFTDPSERKGNTHVEWGGVSDGLKEGVDVLVSGTFKEIRVTTSLSGTELRVPAVAADSVDIIPAKAESSPESSPSPVASLSPTPALSPTPSLTSTPTPMENTPTPMVTPTLVVEATPSPDVPTPESSPTLLPSPSPELVSPTAVPSPTPVPVTATPYPTPLPTPEPPTPTAIPAPTQAPTPPLQPPSVEIQPGMPAQVGLGGAATTEPMTIGHDAEASGGAYLETTRSDQSWNGVGQPPVNTGSATVTVDVAQEGKYAVWARMYYQHIDANSFWLRIDDQQAIKMGNEDGGYEQWKWVGWHDGNTNDRVVVNLSQGSHSIEILGREEGARIDSIVVTDDLNYVPQ